LPSFYASYDKDWASYNAGLVKKYTAGSRSGMTHCAKESHGTLVEYLETLPGEVLFKDFGVRSRSYKVAIERLLVVEMKDEVRHAEQIKSFLCQI
jgi:hypothetical protein